MHPPLWHCVMMCWTSLTINSLFLSPSFPASSSGRSLKPTKPLLLQLLRCESTPPYLKQTMTRMTMTSHSWRNIGNLSDKSIRHKFLTLVCCRHWKQRLFPITGWSWMSTWLPTRAHSSVADGKAVRITALDFLYLTVHFRSFRIVVTNPPRMPSMLSPMTTLLVQSGGSCAVN